MSIQDDITIAVESEAQLTVAKLQIVRIGINRPAAHVRPGSDTYRVDLSITPRARGALACYRERWARHRFEQVGNICIMPPRETVEAKSSGPSSQTSLLCLLQPEPLREWFGGDLKWTDHHLEDSLDVRDPRVRAVLQRMATELRDPGLASNILLGSLVGQLTVDLGRHCTTLGGAPIKGGLAAWRLRLIDERLQEAQAAPSLPELAQLCNLSVRALTQGFRQSRGVSIGAYVAVCQVNHAKHLLLAGNSVKAVAYTLGYSSSASFCYSFKRSAGETPGQFLESVTRH